VARKQVYTQIPNKITSKTLPGNTKLPNMSSQSRAFERFEKPISLAIYIPNEPLTTTKEIYNQEDFDPIEKSNKEILQYLQIATAIYKAKE